VDEVLRRRPTQPVLLMSAYPDGHEAQENGRPSQPFLSKPFTRDQLLAKVAEASQARATEPT
jgi:DNA-binding NtrC family response regulator